MAAAKDISETIPRYQLDRSFYDKVRAAKITATAIVLVGRVLTSTDFADSRLYAPEFTHRFRRAKAEISEK